MPKFIVEYSLAYEHVCRVGITAKNATEAEASAQQMFDEGIIWDNTPDVPLLYDDYEETLDNVLTFSATECDEWKADSSVEAYLRHNGSNALLNVVELIAAGNTDIDRLTELANEALFLARYGRPLPTADK